MFFNALNPKMAFLSPSRKFFSQNWIEKLEKLCYAGILSHKFYFKKV